MLLSRIFVKENAEDGIWSIHLPNMAQNEFDQFLDLMNDPEWLYNFFTENISDLTGGFFEHVTIGEAVLKVMEEVEELEDMLYDFAEKGFRNESDKLQVIFKPLNNFEYAITTHQKSKTRVRGGWLRVYAIRLAENCYLVTGGAIKLTLNMKRKHLENELKKLELTKSFLRENGIEYPEDLNI